MVDSDSRGQRAPARKHFPRRSVAVALASVLAAVAFAAPAAAHVRSDGTPVTQGGYGIVRLIVPGESERAATVALTVTIPEGVDLKSARTLPIPGWTATVERQKVGSAERVSRIVWTATAPANGFGNTEYREFSFSGGPWPKGKDSVALPSDQRYSDGSVVSWNEVAVDKASEPEHPAPIVTLNAAADGHGHDGGHGESATAAGASHHDDTAAPGANESSDGLWHSISVIGLLLALAASVAVAWVLRRDRVTGS